MKASGLAVIYSAIFAKLVLVRNYHRQVQLRRANSGPPDDRGELEWGTAALPLTIAS